MVCMLPDGTEACSQGILGSGDHPTLEARQRHGLSLSIGSNGDGKGPLFLHQSRGLSVSDVETPKLISLS